MKVNKQYIDLILLSMIRCLLQNLNAANEVLCHPDHDQSESNLRLNEAPSYGRIGPPRSVAN